MASALGSDLLGDHRELARAVGDGLDERVDLGDDAELAHALEVHGIGVLEVGHCLAQEHLAVLAALALLEDVEGVRDGRVALRVQREAQARRIGLEHLALVLRPVDVHGAAEVGVEVGLLHLALMLRDGAVGHLVEA